MAPHQGYERNSNGLHASVLHGVSSFELLVELSEEADSQRLGYRRDFAR